VGQEMTSRRPGPRVISNSHSCRGGFKSDLRRLDACRERHQDRDKLWIHRLGGGSEARESLWFTPIIGVIGIGSEDEDVPNVVEN